MDGDGESVAGRTVLVQAGEVWARRDQQSRLAEVHVASMGGGGCGGRFSGRYLCGHDLFERWACEHGLSGRWACGHGFAGLWVCGGGAVQAVIVRTRNVSDEEATRGGANGFWHVRARTTRSSPLRDRDDRNYTRDNVKLVRAVIFKNTA